MPRYFGIILTTPSPVTLCHASRDPLKWHNISDPQVLIVHTYIHTYIYTYIHAYIHIYRHIYTYIHTHTHIYMSLQWVCIIVRGGFIRVFLSRVFCLDGFVRGSFVLSPFCQNISVTIES